MSAKFTLDGNAGGAVRAVEQLNKALDATQKGAEGAVFPTKQLVAAAQRIKESIDPQEKYNRKMADLEKLVKSGALQIDHARVKASQYGTELDKVGKAGDGAFSSAMVSRIAAMAGGIVSATAVVSAIKEAFQQAEAAAQNAADAIFDSLGAVGELGQLGPEGLPKALRIQRDLIQSGTVKPSNRSQAADIAANLINANLTDDEIKLITRDLGGAGGLVKAENLNNVGGNLKSLMTQFGETDMREVAAQVLVAANKTKADLAATSNNVLKFGELAAASGIDLDEAMAGYVASDKSAASPEAAAEMQKSFYSQVYRRKLSTGDLEGTLNKITAAIPKGGTAFDVLGDANAVIGYEALMKDRAGLRANLSDISSPPDGMIRDSRELLGRISPVSRSAQLKAEAEGRYAVALGDISSRKENLFDAYQTELDTWALETGEHPMKTLARRKALSIDDASGSELSSMQGEISRQEVFNGEQRISTALLQEIRDLLKDNAKNTAGTKQGVEEIKDQQRGKVTTRPE